MVKEALEVFSMVVVLDLEHGHSSVCYTLYCMQYAVSRRVAFLICSLWILIDRQLTAAELN